MQNALLSNLDKNQKDVVLASGNLIVYAGAGCGKSYTIIKKINYLINTGINPNEILVISFTNNSVNDLKNKLENIEIKTFHKLAMKILEIKNINYSLINSNYLDYIINEYLYTLNKDKRKYILRYLNYPNNYNKFLKSNEFQDFKLFIKSTINKYSSNPKHINLNSFKRIEKKILLIIFNIYEIYNNEKKSTNKIDLDDLIRLSTYYLDQNTLNYKYIFIDEFQDSSMLRINLIKKINNLNNTSIIVVGDDYQSIYGFSGCDIEVFLNYKNIIPNTNEYKLLNTYRFSNEEIKISNDFINKNKKQIKKELYSDKRNDIPYIFVPYKNNNILIDILEHLLKITNNIIIIGRNNHDIYFYKNNKIDIYDNYIIYKSITIPYYTIHKSKGLQSDYVILINCNNTINGFPNRIKNNSITSKLFPSNEIKFAEERRLFYVAITRNKNQTFLLYNKSTPSIFIKELKWIILKNNLKITYFSNIFHN